ncbi:MAG TPA: HNH endonuclease signature motif containing protein [Sphingobacterium sp.]|nr:HNH endonuclease signature motif containing protein [Sphingobacterium sp.]
MSNINKFGLARRIPADISRVIRQEAGFGCVICGSGIFEYEHIEPEFKSAKEHDPNCMTLLCPSCHSKATRGRLSKKSVWDAKKNPEPLKKGFASDWFDFAIDTMPFITFGGTKTQKCEIPLLIDDIPILRIAPPLEDGTPFLLSGCFYNTEDNIMLEIVDNEWRAFVDNWDINYVGASLTIKDPNGKVILSIRVDPPNGIVIEHLVMIFRGQSIIITPDYIEINKTRIHGGCISDCRVGFSLATR